MRWIAAALILVILPGSALAGSIPVPRSGPGQVELDSAAWETPVGVICQIERRGGGYWYDGWVVRVGREVIEYLPRPWERAGSVVLMVTAWVPAWAYCERYMGLPPDWYAI